MRPRYFYGYNIVAAGFATQAFVVGAMFTYGVFFKELENAFGWSRAMLSGASSLAFLTMGVVGMLAGMLNDRIGPRIILTVSGLSLGAGYMLLSQLASDWQLYLLYGLFVGIGFSTHDVITLSTVARWFSRRRGMMSGLVKVGTGCGQLMAPVAAAAIVVRVGWRHGYLWVGLLSLMGLVCAARFMKRDPERLGLRPDGDAPEGLSSGAPAEAKSIRFGRAVRSLPLWLLCTAEFMIFGCLLTTIVHIVPHARDQGLEPTVAAAVLSTIGGVSIMGRFVMGAANDRIGGKRSLLAGLVILIAALGWLQVATEAWMLFLFAVMYGFAHGALFTVMSPTVAEWFGTESHGLIFGLVVFCGTLGGSAGPLMAGYVFDLTGNYRAAFSLMAAMAFTALVLITFLRQNQAASRGVS